MQDRPLGVAQGAFSLVLLLMRPPYFIALATVAAGLLLVAIYWPGLHGSFFFDDVASILQAEGVRLDRLSFESLRQALGSGYAGPSGRPVAQLSFALNYFFAGYSPFAFKTTNLAVHAACALLVFFLAFRLFAATSGHTPPRGPLIAAGALAAVWLFHPLQLNTVLLAVQRMTSLSALFLFAAVLLHISAREQDDRGTAIKLIAAWMVLWPLSFFSKENGALFPLFALAWELIVRREKTGKLDRFARIFAISACAVFLAGLIYFFSPRGQWLWDGYGSRPFTLGERLLTEGRVLWFYLSLAVFPRLDALGLYHDDIEISSGLLTPWMTLPAIAGLLGLALLAFWTRRRAPLVSFGITWFFIGHALESTILPLEIAHEHRNYVPLFGIFLAGAWALSRTLEKKTFLKTTGITLAVALIINSVFITALRSHLFGDEGLRTQTEALHHPTSARAHHEAGRFLSELPDATSPITSTHSIAREHYRTACELDSNSKMCWLGLIDLNCKAGLPAEKEWIIELIRRLRETPFAPADSNVLFAAKEAAVNGSQCLDRLDIDGLFSAALANPTVTPWTQAILHSWHADYLWLHERNLTAARNALRLSLALNPTNSSNRLKWAQLLFISGERQEALRLLLSLRSQTLSGEERQTLNELLATYNVAGN